MTTLGRRTQDGFERALFACRWLLAPIAAGLGLSLVVLLIVFLRKLVTLLGYALGKETSTGEIIVGILSLVDLSLLGNLVLMVIFAGYENFVSRMEPSTEDRPGWMGRVSFADLKLKLLASIVAISAIQVLELFMQVHDVSDRVLGWSLGIHAVFVASALVLALMDRVTGEH